MKIIRVGVTGGRTYYNYGVIGDALYSTLLNINKVGADMFLVVGDAAGADNIALSWAEDFNIKYKRFDADWDKYGKAAGPIRNKEMLLSGIDKLCAFPGGNGTAHMTKICREAGIYVREYK